MINMKKIIAAALVLSVSFAVNAQEIPERKADKPGMHERHRKGHHGMDMKQLNLTEGQKEQFKKERESFKSKMDELKKNENITVKEWKSRMETIRKDHKSKIDGILTAEQKAQVEKKKIEGKERHEGMMKKRGEEMKTRLGLTDEQSAKLQQNRKEVGEKIKSIRENKSLSEEKKKEEIKEIMKSQKESMKSILTEEQMQKMKEGRKHKPGMDGEKKEMKKTI
jgi:Spy/CpxP family protein refolding chaperone